MTLLLLFAGSGGAGPASVKGYSAASNAAARGAASSDAASGGSTASNA